MWNAQKQRDCPLLNSRSLCLSRWAAISTHQVGLRQAHQMLVSECSECKGEPPFDWVPFLSRRRAQGFCRLREKAAVHEVQLPLGKDSHCSLSSIQLQRSQWPPCLAPSEHRKGNLSIQGHGKAISYRIPPPRQSGLRLNPVGRYIFMHGLHA